MAEMAAANADTGYPDLLRVARDVGAAQGALHVRLVGDALAEQFGTKGSPVSL